MAKFVIAYAIEGVALFGVALSMLSLAGCHSRIDKEPALLATPSIPRFAQSAPAAASSGSLSVPTNTADVELPDPTEGWRLDKELCCDETNPRISDDGSTLAIELVVYVGEGGAMEHYLLEKKVDSNKEIQRLPLEFSADNVCSQPPDSVQYQECARRVEQRKKRVERFLKNYHWNRIPTFAMEPRSGTCGESEEVKPQRLIFPNLRLSFSNLKLVVARADGSVLTERAFPVWKHSDSRSVVSPPSWFFVDHVGIDLKRRVLLVAISYCPLLPGDGDSRFYAIRLPPLN